MKVVLDTSVIAADFHLCSSTFRLFLDSLERAGHTLFVLQIVLEETVNKYREMLLKVLDDLIKVQNEFHRLTRQEIALLVIDESQIQQLVLDYEQELDKRVIGERAPIARFVPYPDVPHFELVRKALRRQKPFSEKGTGYRDALIWQSIMWIAKVYGVEKQKIAFISGDVKDFADGNLHLHADLQNELKEEGLAPDCVVFYPSLKAFNDEQIKGQFEELEDLREELNNNVYDDLDFQEVLLRVLMDRFSDRSVDLGTSFSQGYENPVISKVLEIERYSVADVRRWNTFDDITILVDVDVQTTCLISASIRLSGLSALEQRRLSRISMSLRHPRYAEVEFEMDIRFSLTMFFYEDEKAFDIDSADISIVG